MNNKLPAVKLRAYVMTIGGKNSNKIRTLKKVDPQIKYNNPKEMITFGLNV
jgi:hypothetical protein